MLNRIFRKIIVLMIFLLVGVVSCLNVDLEEILAETHIENVDFSQVASGTYKGEHTAGLVSVVLELVSHNYKVENITLIEHDNLRGSKAEVLTEAIIKEQTLELDVISGATVSSMVILKAVENALRKGIQGEEIQ